MVDGTTPQEIDRLDLTTWTTAGISLESVRTSVATASKEKGWFKRVDKGQRLGAFILETESLHNDPVQDTIEALKVAIYTRRTIQTDTAHLTDGADNLDDENGADGADGRRH